MEKKDYEINTDGSVEPLYDRVLIKRDESDSTWGTNGIIVKADISRDVSHFGTVVACGKGEFNKHSGVTIPLDVKVGDRIAVGKYAGTDIRINFVNYLICREGEILGVISADVAPPKTKYTPTHNNPTGDIHPGHQWPSKGEYGAY